MLVDAGLGEPLRGVSAFRTVFPLPAEDVSAGTPRIFSAQFRSDLPSYPLSGLPVSRHECHTALVLLQTVRNDRTPCGSEHANDLRTRGHWAGCGPNSTCAENMNDENSGCSEGWPSYAIDHVDPSGRASGLVNRVMEWASYLSRVDGELYSGERNGSRTTDTNAPLN
jgi:hypothetical protein